MSHYEGPRRASKKYEGQPICATTCDKKTKLAVVAIWDMNKKLQKYSLSCCVFVGLFSEGYLLQIMVNFFERQYQ